MVWFQTLRSLSATTSQALKLLQRELSPVVCLSDRIPKAAFSRELQTETRFRAGPRKCYKDSLKANFQSCNFDLDNWELLPHNRI